MNFNKAIVAGRLTRDPETRTLPDGQPVTNFGIASNQYFTDKDGNKQKTAEFHNIVAFGKLADICSRYLKKGMPILVEGRLKTRDWQGQDGVKRYKTEILANNMQMGPRSDNTAPVAPYSSYSSPSSPSPRQEPPTITKEEIPVIEAETEPNIELEQKNNQQTENDDPNPDPIQNNAIESEDKGQVEVKNIPF